MLRRIALSVPPVLLILIALSLAAWYLPLANKEPVRIEIKAGDTLTHLAAQWEVQGWLPSATLLRLQARLYGSKLKVGEYDIPAGLSSAELLPFLATAVPVQYRLTLVEGHRVSDVIKLLQETPKLEQDIQPLTYDSIAALLGLEHSVEGQLFADTYVLHTGDKVSTVLKQAHQRLQQTLEQSWQQRAEDLPYRSAYEALIMASIIEKETAVPNERPRIAGVFVRRLQKRMRLETDPTVIYGLGEQYQGNLKRVHLRDSDNKFNTYRHFGLPPTPIALVGREAIEAALHPLAGNELFFVARGDGTHAFSATLDEHNKAVRQYQLKRVKDYRSSPQPSSTLE